jgi:hypothetical protein
LPNALAAFDFTPENVNIGVVVVNKEGSLFMDVYEAIQDMPPNSADTEASILEQYSQFEDAYLVPAQRGKKSLTFSLRGFWNVPADKLPLPKWHEANMGVVVSPSVFVVVIEHYDPSLIGCLALATALSKLVIFKTKEVASAYEDKFPGVVRISRQMISGLVYGSGWHWAATHITNHVCGCENVQQYLSQVLSP